MNRSTPPAPSTEASAASDYAAMLVAPLVTALAIITVVVAVGLVAALWARYAEHGTIFPRY